MLANFLYVGLGGALGAMSRFGDAQNFSPCFTNKPINSPTLGAPPVTGLDEPGGGSPFEEGGNMSSVRRPV